MSAAVYNNLALDWKPENQRDSFFNRLAIGFVIFSVIIAIVVNMIDVPEKKRAERTHVPERVAKFILNKPKPKPKPKPAKPKPKPVPKLIKRVKPKTKSNKPLTKKQQTARKKAEKSGLLALSNELSDLMDTSAVSAMVNKKVTKGSSHKQAALVNKSLLTKNSSSGSGGVKSGKFVTTTSKTVLTHSEKVAFKQSLLTNGKPKLKGKRYTRSGDNLRSEEDVIFVMDQNKSKLHSIYRRARRVNPGLRGKIVLEITIAPSGKVSTVRVKSNELKDEKLVARLIARIKGFNFGGEKVEPVTVTFPIEFLPS